jgi:hypothetical protein
MKPPLPPLDEAPWEPPSLAGEDVDAPELTGRYPRTEVAMTCGVHNRPFIVAAELRGNVCFFVENRLPSAAEVRDRSEPFAAVMFVGYFKCIDAHPQWRCPHCGARDNPILKTHLVRFCCQNMTCAGTVDGMAYCSCGCFRAANASEFFQGIPRGGDVEGRVFTWGTLAGQPPTDVCAASGSFVKQAYLLEPGAGWWPVHGGWLVYRS